MRAEVYQMISMAAFGCGGILTLIAVILFLKFDVPSLIGELSGRTAEKKVQEIREQNRQAVSMRQRGTERRHKVSVYDTGTEAAGRTSKGVMEPGKQEEKAVKQNAETAVPDEETVVLDEGTTVLEETTVVLDEGTTILEETVVPDGVPIPENNDFCMVQDVVEVHTAETI